MSTDAPAYAPAGTPPDPAPGRRRLRWLVAGAAAWAVLLGGLAYLSARDDAPTVREQRTVAEATPVVDRAAGELVAAADGPDVVLALAPPRLDRGCRITPVRRGVALRRSVTARVPEAGARAVLDRIAHRLPARYRALVSGTGSKLRLDADAGEFVAVRGTLTGPGLIELTADTGCRPVPDGFDVAGTAPAPAAEQQLRRILTERGVTATDPTETVSVPCPGGGGSGTARAAVPGDASVDKLHRPAAGAAVVTDTPEVYAYRDGAVSVIVEREPDPSVSVTTGCA